MTQKHSLMGKWPNTYENRGLTQGTEGNDKSCPRRTLRTFHMLETRGIFVPLDIVPKWVSRSFKFTSAFTIEAMWCEIHE